MSDSSRRSHAQSVQQSMSSFLPEGGGEQASQQQPQQSSRECENPEFRKLHFPSKVSAAVRDAIRTYKPPDGYSVAVVPDRKPHQRQSVISFYGVRLEISPKEGERDLVAARDSRSQKWVCLADNNCRKSQRFLKIKSDQTTNATTHLKDIHHITGEASAKTTKRKADEIAAKEHVFQDEAYHDNPSRYNQLQFVKSFVIGSACPFTIAERPAVRHCLSVLCPDKLEVDGLNHKAVRRIVVELYHATSRKFQEEMLATIRKALIKIVYINCDLWQSKVSGDKYIGLRVFYMNDKGILQTHLLAVKLFRPDPELRVTGPVVLKWLRQAMTQHGLRDEHIAGAVTDAGADVSTGVARAFHREWCFPHMVNRALLEGTGMSGSSKNTERRDLVNSVKSVIQYFNRSSQSKIMLENACAEMGNGKRAKGKLSQAVNQRWTSVCKMLLRFLQKWPALVQCYVEQQRPFSLVDKKTELEELYSMFRALKDFTVYCQTTHEPTAEGAMSRIVELLAITFEPAKHLTIFRVPVALEDNGDANNDANEDGPTLADKVNRPHVQLAPLGRKTREAIGNAIAKRFLARYGGQGLEKRIHLFDHAMLLSPSMRRMRYLDIILAGSLAKSVCGLESGVDVRAKIKDEVVGLLAGAVKELKARDERAAEGLSDAVDLTSPRASSKGAATTTRNGSQSMKDLGLFSDSSDDEQDHEQEVPAEEEARTILNEWLNSQLKTEQKGLAAGEYWRRHGPKLHPALRALAQAVHGCPASAGVMERDFCIADWFLPRKRGSMDPAMLEMCLFLRAQYGYIPNDVSKFKDKKEEDAAIPKRLSDEQMLKDVEQLDFVPESSLCDDIEGGNDGGLAGEWMLPMPTSASRGDQASQGGSP